MYEGAGETESLKDQDVQRNEASKWRRPRWPMYGIAKAFSGKRQLNAKSERKLRYTNVEMYRKGQLLDVCIKNRLQRGEAHCG